MELINNQHYKWQGVAQGAFYIPNGWFHSTSFKIILKNSPQPVF